MLKDYPPFQANDFEYLRRRMRTVAGADQVVVLSGGIVAEQGSPAELYARKGLYTHMVDLQSASQNWTI